MTDTDTMTPSQAALDLLHEFEQGPQGGMASVPYCDFAGHPTIGWGHRILPRERFSKPLTVAQSDDLLRSDLERFAAAVNSWVTAPITQSMFDALVCFVYNIGIGNFMKSTMLKLINAGDFVAAAHEFDKWTKAAGKVMPGLVTRRHNEEDLFNGVA